MNRDERYERRQFVSRMESILIVASGLGVMTGVTMLLAEGIGRAFPIFLLSLVALALSRVFETLDALLGAVGRNQERQEKANPKR